MKLTYKSTIIYYILSAVTFFLLYISEIMKLSKKVFIVFNIIILVAYLYIVIFVWIVNKSKLGINKEDFFSTWGRRKIRDNIQEYFDDQYAPIYQKIISLIYIWFLIVAIAMFFIFKYSDK